MRREPTYFQKDGRWAFRVSLGLDPATGRRIQPQRQGFRTKRDAQDAAEALIRQFDLNAGSPPTDERLDGYLRTWLTTRAVSLRPSSMRSYRMAVDRIVQHFGSVRLADLRPLQIERFYAELINQGLSPKTVANTHTVLRKSLADADRLGIIGRNPAATARPPSVPRHEAQVWTELELNAFVQFLDGHRLQALFVLLGLTGVRRGEALALRWKDVNLDRRVLSVVQSLTSVDNQVILGSPKTQKSRRQVPLDHFTVDYLRDHRQRQREERLRAGSAWNSEGDWVFRDELGNHLHPDFVSRLFRRLVDASKLPRIRLHDLRHTYGTMCLSAGIHPKVVSERLGHATVGITMDIYSHVSEGMSRNAAEIVAENVFGRARRPG